MSARRLGAVLALCVALAACATTGPDTIAGAIEQQRQASKTKDVRPPEEPDLTRTGRIGVRLAINSVGWQRVLHIASTKGTVVLFVLPSSPAERGGLKRGDVITRVGSTPIANDERAQIALRGKPGVPLKVTVDRGDEELVLTVTPGPLADADQIALLDAVLAKHPKDATTLLLRAQLTQDQKDALRYVNRALDAEPDLVDGLVFRARLYWTESLSVTNESVIATDRSRANDDYRRALEIDPDAITVLRSRAQSSLEIQQYDSAERDGLRAIGLDATFPAAYYSVAAARYADGRARDAASPAREAVRLDPYDSNLYRILALVFVELGRVGDAEETVRVGLTVATDENKRAALKAVVEP